MLKFYTLLAICTLLCLSTQAQFSQPGELDTTFNFGRPHSFFTDPANPQPGKSANGTIITMVRQPDGKILIGGSFTIYNGIDRNCIARLNADGSLDSTFNPSLGADVDVYSIALQPDGKLIIGGFFTSYNGIGRNYIARLNADGSLDASFNPGTGANDWVLSLALQPDGKLLIVGYFTSFNGVLRNRIARLNVDGSLDPTFNPGTGANNWVWSLALQPDGKVIIGGQFTSFSSISRNHIARLNSDGSLDLSFNPGTGANDVVYSLFLQPDNKVLIGGDFTSYNNLTRNRVARLNSNGSLDLSFNPGSGVNNTVFSFALLPNGKLLIGGSFTIYNGTALQNIARLNANGSLDGSFNLGSGVLGSPASISSILIQPNGKMLIAGGFSIDNGAVRNRIACLSINGSLDISFNPSIGANNWVSCLALQSDGKVIIGGDFISYDNTVRNRIARLNDNGSLDTTFNPGIGANAIIETIILQADGKILIGGEFTNYNGVTQNRIARLNPNGSLDSTFMPGSGADGRVRVIALQSDGRIIVAGDFSIFGGLFKRKITRLNSNGSMDVTFNSSIGIDGGLNNFIYALAVQTDGKILIGGDFTSFIFNFRNHIARLNSDGSLDMSFNPGTGANGWVYSLYLQPDGKVLIGGEFTSYNGTVRNRIARLNTDGSLDSTFNPGAGSNYRVSSVVIQPEGHIITAGNFTSYNNVSRNYITRLNVDGSLDSTFNPGQGPNWSVQSVALQPDGKVIIGGFFTSYNGIYRPSIARLLTKSISVGIPLNDVLNLPQSIVYPVPFLEELKIKARFPFSYELLTIYGIMKIKGTTNTYEATINTGNLARGIYLVRVTFNGQSQIHKVMKE
jgi:uncharacterized delta-60 repeat protein